MKHKSLRQLARELGVSHSYLSQVQHGKRPASKKVVSMVSNSGKQNEPDLATKLVVGANNPKVAGSNPAPATKIGMVTR